MSHHCSPVPGLDGNNLHSFVIKNKQKKRKSKNPTNLQSTFSSSIGSVNASEGFSQEKYVGESQQQRALHRITDENIAKEGNYALPSPECLNTNSKSNIAVCDIVNQSSISSQGTNDNPHVNALFNKYKASLQQFESRLEDHIQERFNSFANMDSSPHALENMNAILLALEQSLNQSIDERLKKFEDKINNLTSAKIEDVQQKCTTAFKQLEERYDNIASLIDRGDAYEPHHLSSPSPFCKELLNDATTTLRTQVFSDRKGR